VAVMTIPAVAPLPGEPRLDKEPKLQAFAAQVAVEGTWGPDVAGIVAAIATSRLPHGMSNTASVASIRSRTRCTAAACQPGEGAWRWDRARTGLEGTPAATL
jgi:hypothetical protein